MRDKSATDKLLLRIPVKLPFDPSSLMGHLNTDDSLAMVIRAHLYVESILIHHIESAFVAKPAGFDITGLNFPIKLNLAAALGKLDADAVAAYSALNRLRRKFAHDFRTELRERDEIDLYNTFSRRQREIADVLRESGGPLMERLRFDLLALVWFAGASGPFEYGE